MDEHLIGSLSNDGKEINETQFLNVLIVTSAPIIEQRDNNPIVLQPYDFSDETSRLEKILDINKITYTILPHATIDKFHTAVIAGDFNVVYFNGHGDNEGQLLFETSVGAVHRVPPQQFADLLTNSCVTLTYLSACHSQVSAEWAKFNVPAVISVLSRASIHVRAAALFADKFFTALTQGWTLIKAFQAGQKAVAADYEVGDNIIPSDGEGHWSKRFTIACPDETTSFGHIGHARDSGNEILSIPNNLPQPKTGELFIGRELDLYAVNENLRNFQSINVFGEPGAGKSSLALAVAQWQLKRHLYPDGIIWHSTEYDCSLSGLTTTISTVLGQTTTPLTPQAIVSHFRQKNFLLIIDNFETVLNESATDSKNSAEIVDYLASLSGNSRIITTSRRREIGLAGELPFGLDGLSPENASLLFWTIADRLGWQPDDEKDPETDMANICRLLGYLPLTIKLAAPLVAKEHYSLGELYQRLCEKGQLLRSLKKDARGLPERLRDYRASLLLSFEALDVEARRVFVSMSVFAGGADEKGIQAVLGQFDSSPRQKIADLEDRCLIKFQAKPSNRWFLPPNIADFTNEKINDIELDINIKALYLTHSKHYLTVTQTSNFSEILSDWENIRLGFNRLVDTSENHSLIIDYFKALNPIITHLVPTERMTWLERSMIAAKATNNQEAIAMIQHHFALVYSTKGNNDAAISCFKKSMELYKKIGNLKILPAIYNNIGENYRYSGDYDTALSWYEEALKNSHDLEEESVATINNNVGLIHCEQGNYDKALSIYEKNVKIQIKLEDAIGLATSYNNIGHIHHKRNDLKEALIFYKKSLDISKKVSYIRGLAMTYINIGGVHYDNSNPEKADDCYKKGIEFADQLGGMASIAQEYYGVDLSLQDYKDQS